MLFLLCEFPRICKGKNKFHFALFQRGRYIVNIEYILVHISFNKIHCTNSSYLVSSTIFSWNTQILPTKSVNNEIYFFSLFFHQVNTYLRPNFNLFHICVFILTTTVKKLVELPFIWLLSLNNVIMFTRLVLLQK